MKDLNDMLMRLFNRGFRVALGRVNEEQDAYYCDIHLNPRPQYVGLQPGETAWIDPTPLGALRVAVELALEELEELDSVPPSDGTASQPPADD